MPRRRLPYTARLICWLLLFSLAIFVFLRHFLAITGTRAGSGPLEAVQDIALLVAAYVIVQAIETFGGD